jgi:hypothetical protein
MMSSHISRILKLGLLMGDMVVSAAGCFVFMRGFRVVTGGQEGTDARSSMRAHDAKPLAGIGAALFLLAFVASEAAATVVALHH